MNDSVCPRRATCPAGKCTRWVVLAPPAQQAPPAPPPSQVSAQRRLATRWISASSSGLLKLSTLSTSILIQGKPTAANHSTSTETNTISTNQLCADLHNHFHRLPPLCRRAHEQGAWCQGRRHSAHRLETPRAQVEISECFALKLIHAPDTMQVFLRREDCRGHLHRRHLLKEVSTFWGHPDRG